MSETSPIRLRSVLYMPGANERALEKAKGLAADALILDLEDAVAPAAKEEARERVAAAVGAYPSKTVTIRVNAIGTRWHARDVEVAGQAGPDAIVVPKVGSVADVLGVADALEAAGAPERTAIWAMIESPAAILHAEAIAAATERLTVLVMGTNDLLKELYATATPGREALLTSLKWAVLSARAANKMILDGVYNDVKNLEGFTAEALQGKQFGFDGKTLIHPGQIEPTNTVFSPSAEEIAHAEKVIAAFEEAEAAGAGVVTVDGAMIENLHVETARRILTLAG
ncbi:CoA ester lyase [Conexibacter sp. DBS9H8]|uniref:HpcH/HpaI aldolase/citrate lyase family protein n=1 Tax=Conexibacter sp. DBS9H8 TaxID=2937801 RepID=UPI00201064B7|nr:CoA ester lyase [Conexibacter sp. DBS9H8]